MLNREAIAGALTVKHGHVQAEMTAQAYIQAFLRAGGEMQIAHVEGLLQQGNAVKGVKATSDTYHSANTVICAGGFSRTLLKAAGISVRLYFTHAEMIETPPVDLQLHTLVMPANLTRFQIEAAATTNDSLWDEAGNEPVPAIIDPGAIQFLNRSLRIGQLSRVLTDTNARLNPEASEAAIRASVAQVLPGLGSLSGTWHHCLVSFSSDRLPLIGSIPSIEGIHIFSGLSNPLVIVPPLAQRFANCASGKEDEIIRKFSPIRFTSVSEE